MGKDPVIIYMMNSTLENNLKHLKDLCSCPEEGSGDDGRVWYVLSPGAHSAHRVEGDG